MTSRRTPIRKLNVMGSPDIDPAKQIGDILEMKQHQKYWIKTIGWEFNDDSIESIIYQSNQEYNQMLLSQRKMYEDRKLQRTIDETRIKEAFKLTSYLRTCFANTNVFLKDCDTKKNNSKKKLSEEKQKHIEVRKTINKYRDDIDMLTEFRDTLSEKVKDMAPYEKIVNDVIATGNYSSVKDCMDRCDALMLAYTEITDMNKLKLEEIENMRVHMAQTAKEGAVKVLKYLNEISELERGFYHAALETTKWENILANVKDRIVENEIMKERINDGIQLMYRTICKIRGIDPIFHDIERRMDFIKNEIQIYQQVVKECGKKVDIDLYDI